MKTHAKSQIFKQKSLSGTQQEFVLIKLQLSAIFISTTAKVELNFSNWERTIHMVVPNKKLILCGT